MQYMCRVESNQERHAEDFHYSITHSRKQLKKATEKKVKATLKLISLNAEEMTWGPTWMLALWLGIPEDREINTVMWDEKSIRSGCK